MASKIFSVGLLFLVWWGRSMALQRFTVVKIAGEPGRVVSELFDSWRAARASGVDPDQVRRAVDDFCEQLRQNGVALPVIYFSEWIDRWLMGDLATGPQVTRGNRFEAHCGSPAEAFVWADRCGNQFPEQRWLAMRLREAAGAWQLHAGSAVVLLVREVLGASTTDEEVTASLQVVPEWLCSKRTENYKPGTFGCHELLDRTLMAADLVERFVLSHPACAQNPAWYALAEQAASCLHELYQQIGAAHLNGESGTRDAAPS
jgi:hypothetical protein